MLVSDQVTVFIPLKHHHERYLRQAIESVFNQTRSDWRLLIVVHAEDEMRFRAILAEPLADDRVRLLCQTGARLAGAYNSAMRAAETAFVAVLLGDDLLAPNAVEVVGDYIRACPSADFFHSGRYVVDSATRRISSDYQPSLPVNAETFVLGSPVKHLLCWRAQVGLACGGVDETLENFGSDDYDFPWVMLEHGAIFQAIPDPLYIYRDHRDGPRLTTHLPRSAQRRGLRRILRKHGIAPTVIRARVRDASRQYLRQSLFRNAAHRWVLERIGFDAQKGWRDQYR
jgi:glycosyltransferase involved in cell wall biosynthesis